MSFIGNLFKFEKFKMGRDLMELKSHPQRLLFGGMMDPFSTKLENTLTGSHFKPRSDQMGGAYGGRTISAFGGGQHGGVYKEAEDHGIDTSAGKAFENAAHIGVGVAGAVAGGAALAGAGAGAGAGGAGAGASASGAGALTEFTPAEIAAMGGGTTTGATGAGIGAGAATESYSPSAIEATRASSSPSWMKYMRMGNAVSKMGQQQGDPGMQPISAPASDAAPIQKKQSFIGTALSALKDARPQSMGGADAPSAFA